MGQFGFSGTRLTGYTNNTSITLLLWLAVFQNMLTNGLRSIFMHIIDKKNISLT